MEFYHHSLPRCRGALLSAPYQPQGPHYNSESSPPPSPKPPHSLLPRSRVPLSQASFQGFVFLSVRKIEAFGRSFLNLLSNIKTHIGHWPFFPLGCNRGDFSLPVSSQSFHPHQDSTHHLLLLFPGTYTTIDFLYFKLLPHKLHHVIIQQSLWDSFLAPASALSLCSSWA